MVKNRFLLIFILAITLIVGTTSPALADKACQDIPYDFVHSHTLEFAPGDWTSGIHSYQVKVTFSDSSVIEFDPINFEVTESTPVFNGQVFMRYWGLLSSEGPTLSIHPNQDTLMQVSWAYELDMNMVEMKAERDGLIVEFSWDGGDYKAAPAGPIRSYCAVVNNGNFMRTWGGPLE